MKQRYTKTAVTLHWVVALALLGTFALGVYMHDLPLTPQKLKLYSWHKWAGMTVFALVLFRLAWRVTHKAPALPSSMGPGARAAAHAGHWVLYALMVAIPLSGWLMSSAQGFQVVWFGVVPLPDLVSRDADLGEALKTTHVVLNYAMLAAVVGHVGAALHHHFVKKDTVLSRMVPVIGKHRRAMQSN